MPYYAMPNEKYKRGKKRPSPRKTQPPYPVTNANTKNAKKETSKIVEANHPPRAAATPGIWCGRSGGKNAPQGQSKIASSISPQEQPAHEAQHNNSQASAASMVGPNIIRHMCRCWVAETARCMVIIRCLNREAPENDTLSMS